MRAGLPTPPSVCNISSTRVCVQSRCHERSEHAHRAAGFAADDLIVASGKEVAEPEQVAKSEQGIFARLQMAIVGVA